ncbi:MAG: FecR domain-containing protein [Polyangiales bacterium]
MGRFWGIFLGLWAVSVCSACSMCNQKPAVAEVRQAQGHVERDHAEQLEVWGAAEVGARLQGGDGLRTMKRAGAQVELFDGSQLKLGERTLVRFHLQRPRAGQAGFDVEMGRAMLQVGEEPLRLRTQVGMARLSGGSELRLVALDRERIRFEVVVGDAQLNAGGKEQRLRAGMSFEAEVGNAVMETGEEVPEAPQAEAAEASAEPAPPDGTAVDAVIEGRGVRARTPDSKRWEPLAAGATTLAPGTTVKVSPRAEVKVSRAGSEAVLKGNGQYVVMEASQGLVRALSGRLTLRATRRQTQVWVRGGVVAARERTNGSSTSEVRLKGRGDATIYVRSGSIDLRGSVDKDTLRAGESATLSAQGTLDVGGRGPAWPHILVNPGESFTVRDPKPPTAIGFRLKSVCPGGGVVELMRGRKGRPRASSRGEQRANLAFPPGSHRYQVRCIGGQGVEDKAVAKGRIRIMRDSGMTRIPKSAPSTLVDADGRRYTVLYQNLLPEIEVRWRRAPASSKGYQLQIDAANGKRLSFKSAKPRYKFRTGELLEGTHRFRFRALSSSRQSKETRLRIDFDNAAPKASVREPKNGSFAPGDTVHVAGVALEGWSVSLRGKRLPLDRQHRFSADTVVPKDVRALAVRLANPKRGVHYYLRRTTTP